MSAAKRVWLVHARRCISLLCLLTIEKVLLREWARVSDKNRSSDVETK